MRTMMQFLFQAMNFRGPAAKPFRDLIQGGFRAGRVRCIMVA